MNPVRRLLLANKSWAQERRARDRDYFSRLAGGQRPDFLWISCSDSRVPETHLTVTDPGELFVHRNVANVVWPDDRNALSVIHYAIEALAVRHVIVCGHYGCGGVKAALDGQATGVLGDWLQPVTDLRDQHRAALEALPERERWDKLVELSTIAQVHRLAQTPVVRAAWERGERPFLHGWVYSMPDGLIHPLITLTPSGEQPIF